MIRIEREKDKRLLRTLLSDKFTEEDYEKLMRALQQSVNEWNNIRWYIELRDFSGWAEKANLQYLKINIENPQEVGKVAMAGGLKWQEWLTKALKGFPQAELRYFGPSQKEEAKEWIGL